MPNLRLVHDNAADRAVITASSTAGASIAVHMQTDIKGSVHRASGSAVTYTLMWPNLESVGAISLPATNLSPMATIRARLYDADTAGELLVDTGLVYACPGALLELWDWTEPLNANAFAYGGASKTAVWFEHVAARRVEIELSDPENPAGYIDCARIVAGAYWEPEHNASYGLAVNIADMSTSDRADSGDLRTDRGPQYDEMELDLEWLDARDRARVMQIMRGTSGGRKVFVSVFPGDTDALLEQDHMIYGGLAAGGVIAARTLSYSKKISIQGW
ncbi:hypothetical protein FXN63_19770 [Pigmentiphaga aceris]|uniref:Uncharacterized protein n=1 Tax=Pigmentiphaga aceris TaxID=1940612 RepID=A0A5C0B1S0_9BURK|nr:hypothetical protein [Pigmentiphaga aceris]QEI07824.1 hypothetical protein FXN63_19770 [Pigmentiphaga aceris]